MLIGGLQKFSLLDYPGYVSAIVFTQGCNFRCHFCYNPMLVWPSSVKTTEGKPEEVGKVKNISSQDENQKGHSLISEDDLFVFLEHRLDKLDAVVVTGGEPTIHKDLPEFLKKIRYLGYQIKLDTNGTNPEMLEGLIKKSLVDYIAMDLKAPFEKYDVVAGVQPDLSKIKKSIKIIKKGKIPYEFRTTVVPDLIQKEDIKKMGEQINGGDRWFLQKFKSDGALVNKSFQEAEVYSDEDMEELRKIASKYVKLCEVR